MMLVAVVYLAMYARHGIVQRQDRVHATHVQVAGAVKELRAVCERLLFAGDLTGTTAGAARARLEAQLDIARLLLPEPRLLPPATPEPGAASVPGATVIVDAACAAALRSSRPSSPASEKRSTGSLRRQRATRSPIAASVPGTAGGSSLTMRTMVAAG